MAGLELPGLEFLAFSMGSELHLHCALAQLRHWFSLWPVAEFIGLHPPGLSKVIHVELEVSVSTNQVITFMPVVVATETAKLALEMGGSHDLHKTVSIPGYLQTCFGGHFQEVAVQVDVKVGRVAGQRDAGAVPAHGEVLLQADGAVAQHQLHRLGPGEGTGPASVVLHQYLKG